jgi:alpha-tubulin suppressor-like RCC1 family protein
MYVTGNMDNGKLGLGSAWSSGVLLNFTHNQTLQKIKYVTCGPNHMLAITDNKSDSTDPRSGIYAWG